LDATSSSSVTAVVGYSSLWKDLDLVDLDRERAARPRGAAQPVTPEMDGKPKPRPGMRLSMGTPISKTTPRALGITTPLSPTERMKEAMAPKGTERSKSPDRAGAGRMTLRPSVALSPRGAGLSPPTTPRTPRAGEKVKVTPDKDFKRPVFLSPSFSGGAGVGAKPPGSAPSRSAKSQYSRGELGPANTLSRGLESPRVRAPDQDPLSPKPARPAATVHELVEGGHGTAASDERARMMFEIQASLRNCSNEELSTIARQIRM